MPVMSQQKKCPNKCNMIFLIQWTNSSASVSINVFDFRLIPSSSSQTKWFGPNFTKNWYSISIIWSYACVCFFASSTHFQEWLWTALVSIALVSQFFEHENHSTMLCLHCQVYLYSNCYYWVNIFWKNSAVHKLCCTLFLDTQTQKWYELRILWAKTDENILVGITE